MINNGYDIFVPSQREESKMGVDAIFKIGKRKAYLFQYKVASKYERKPKEFTTTGDCYRFILHKKDKYKQHNLIVRDYRKKLKCGYLAPLFITNKELINNYRSAELLQNCILIFSKYYIIDDDYHYMNYNDSEAFQHSKDCEKCEALNFAGLANMTEHERINLKELLELLFEEDIKNEKVKMDDLEKNPDYFINEFLYENNSILIFK